MQEHYVFDAIWTDTTSTSLTMNFKQKALTYSELRTWASVRISAQKPKNQYPLPPI